MIYEGSCETEAGSNVAENLALITGINYILKEKEQKKQKAVILNSRNNSQYYCFCCILDQINAGLVSRREFFKKH